MKLGDFYYKIKNRIQEFWSFKIFRYAIVLHGIYFIISLVLTLTVFRYQNDFRVYFRVGEVFINDIRGLYDPLNFMGMWPFRYFPLSGLLFVPFYLLGFEIGYVIFNIINVLLNLLICIVLYKIIILIRGKNHEEEENRVLLYISLYLISIPQVFNYILGQINLYVTLLILISLYLFLKYNNNKWNFIASFILGISVNIKPITLFLIPFLIMINFDREEKKIKIESFKSLIRLSGFILPVLLNIIMFLIYPELLEGFLNVNITGEETILKNHSFSITKLIQNLLVFIGFSQTQLQSFQLPIFIIILLIFAGTGFLIYFIRRFNNYSLIFGYTFGILIMLLGYFDSWDHHLLILTPLLIIMIFNFPRNSNITKKFIKPSFFFLSFLDLVFMGIWFIIQDYFPFNFVSTIFLLLIFYGVSKYCLTKDSINQ